MVASQPRTLPGSPVYRIGATGRRSPPTGNQPTGPNQLALPPTGTITKSRTRLGRYPGHPALPRPRDAKLWEWRNSADIRPVVFKDTGNMDRKQVHLHLEHRAVQRLLGGFKTRGFHQGTVSRVCACKTDAFTQPHVALIGRISLYGPNAGRLYDNLVMVIAQWRPPGTGELKILSQEEGEPVWNAILQSLAQTTQTLLSQDLQDRLLNAFQRDVEALSPVMEARTAKLEKKIKINLRSRGDSEAKKMKAILQSQKELLISKMNPQETVQLELPGHEEQNQYKREQKHWENRLAGIDEEMENEPTRVRRAYSVQAARFEPTGLVWLWPTTA